MPDRIVRDILGSDHLRKNVLSVLVGGYAIGLFLWEAGHKAQLQEFITTNQVSPGQGPSLLLLAGSATLIALAWLGLSMLVAFSSHRNLVAVLDLGAALILATSKPNTRL
jgi:hypothetical protein